MHISSGEGGRRRIVLLLSLFVLAGCSDAATVTSPAATTPRASADAGARDAEDEYQVPASITWNRIARDYVASLTVKPNQQANLRAFAYLSLAQYQAVRATSGDDDQEHAESDDGDPHHVHPSARGAVAGASAAVLEYVFPGGTTTFETDVASQAAQAAQSEERGARFAAGEAIGRAVGAKVVASAQADRFDAVWTGTVPVGPGLWVGTNPLLPLLGQMRPFYLSAGSEFRPPPPPHFGSPEFRAALDEIRHFSDTRTPEQLAIAQKWAGTTGSLVAGLWNTMVDHDVTAHRLGESRAAHVLMLTNTAAMDANIACHDGKYTYWFIRPFQADPMITTPIGRPNHPSYPSNHACVSGAFGYVLGGLFPSERATWAAVADEAGESRLYAGIHYRFDKDAGLTIARQVSALALALDAQRQREQEHER
jgi:membrane-associated phospholipid phosphatase